MTDKEKIDRTRDRIKDCPFASEDTKEGLQSLLDDAYPTDGKPIDTNELMSTLCNQWVLHVLNSYAVIDERVQKHEVGCPLKDTPKGKVGIALQFAKCWPLMTAVAAVFTCSPWVPQILTFVKDVIK